MFIADVIFMPVLPQASRAHVAHIFTLMLEAAQRRARARAMRGAAALLCLLIRRRPLPRCPYAARVDARRYAAQRR